MAIKLNAKKGGLSINKGYLVVTNIQMQKYLCPVEQEDKSVTMVDAVRYVARCQVYNSQDDREENFGMTDLNFGFSFDHTHGNDPVQEAYAYIKANRFDGWDFTSMQDV